MLTERSSPRSAFPERSRYTSVLAISELALSDWERLFTPAKKEKPVSTQLSCSDPASAVSVNTGTHKCLMTSCYHQCTAAGEYRSPGRYETLPCYNMCSFEWMLLHQLPWWSHSVLQVPDPEKKPFCQAYSGFNNVIPFWNRFLKQSLLPNVQCLPANNTM